MEKILVMTLVLLLIALLWSGASLQDPHHSGK